MIRSLRVGGHPLHAALSDFPMVLLLLWVALDGTALACGSPLLWMLGRWALIGGTVAAVIAASAGFLDYLSLGTSASGSRALRTASAHLAVMLSVTAIAAIDLVYRAAAPPGGLCRVLHIGALVLVGAGLGAGGWLGGHLVFQYGVGVMPGDRQQS